MQAEKKKTVVERSAVVAGLRSATAVAGHVMQPIFYEAFLTVALMWFLSNMQMTEPP